MQKTAKLKTVFNRYIEFCNEHCPKKKVDTSMVEFVHTQVLNPDDNAESAALMKNDCISVRREQAEDRRNLETEKRIQRESDKEYFEQLKKSLLPPATADKYADIILNCNTNTPNSITIPCHSILIRKRCPWLFQMIQAAKQGRPVPQEQVAPSGAAKIESEEEEDDNNNNNRRSNSSGMELEYDTFSKTWVTLNYPPQAVRILLEYIYSNRVVDLGMAAFTEACRTKPQYKKGVGPVPPHSLRSAKKWPNGGEPCVSLEVALSALDLAVAAQQDRLSLMCQVAAARLVDCDTAVEALKVCQKYNGLPKLRQAAMERVLTDPKMEDVLQDNNKDTDKNLVGTLLAGTLAVLETSKRKTKKRDWQEMAFSHFDMYDKLDILERDAERQHVDDSVWGKIKTRTLKRMQSHTVVRGRSTRKRRSSRT